MFGEHIVVRCHSNHTMCTGGCIDVESNHDLILEAGQETYVNGGNADQGRIQVLRKGGVQYI